MLVNVVFPQIQEFRTGSTRQNMETVHIKEENKRLKQQLTDLRDKFNESDGRVSQQQQQQHFINE